VEMPHEETRLYRGVGPFASPVLAQSSFYIVGRDDKEVHHRK
jgi:hypothetical protein